MGFLFDIKAANIVGYLTTSNRRPPRVTGGELATFLGNFTDAAIPITEWMSEVLISSSPQWIAEVKRAGTKAYEDLNTARVDWSAPVPEDEFITRLAVLQRLFSDYNLFCLAFGDWNDNLQLRTFINYAAITSGHHALFLVPLGSYNHL